MKKIPKLSEGADVSFVILSFNDAKMVMRAVESIRRLQTRYAYDIFVVDNASKDRTADRVERECKKVNVIRLPKNIGTAAYDAAMKQSRAKYIYFTGCDIEVKEDMLDKLIGVLEEDDSVAQAAPKYLSLHDKKSIDLGGTWLSRSFYSGTFKDNALGEKTQEIPYIGTGLLRRDFINKWGYLFDNDYFFYGEDVDLGLRIRLEGMKVMYVPDSIVYHAGSLSRSIHRPAKLTYLMERNLLRTLFTSLFWWNILLFLPYVLIMRIVAMVKDILTLRFTNAAARLGAILWIFLHPGKVWGKRSVVQKTRKVSDANILGHFSEKHMWKSFFRWLT